VIRFNSGEGCLDDDVPSDVHGYLLGWNREPDELVCVDYRLLHEQVVAASEVVNAARLEGGERVLKVSCHWLRIAAAVQVMEKGRSAGRRVLGSVARFGKVSEVLSQAGSSEAREGRGRATPGDALGYQELQEHERGSCGHECRSQGVGAGPLDPGWTTGLFWPG
jgi:hypothetical protein